MSKILTDVKLVIGSIPDEDTSFDGEILLHINSKLKTVNQLGAGKPGFSANADSTWEEFLGDNETDLDNVKTFVGLSVKLLFDPPQNSFLVNAIQDELKETEFRINSTAEYGL